jgi:hypothetical protein
MRMGGLRISSCAGTWSSRFVSSFVNPLLSLVGGTPD